MNEISPSAVSTVTSAELERSLRSSSPPRVFEALSLAHHASGHIPGAVAMPLDGIDAIARRFAPDPDSEIVVYCSNAACRNSHLAASRLVALGYRKVRVYPGGKAEWRDAGLPLEVTP